MALLQITEPGQAVDPHDRKRAAGIDLGTTNSLVASVRENQPQTLPDIQGRHLLPSVVRYGEDDVVVGQDAEAAAVADPLNTIVSVKRMMGRGIADLADLSESLPYEFADDDGGMPMITTRQGHVSPVAVSAEILKNLAARAEETLGGELHGVVITVPSYFDDAQRQATRDAATIAGLNVLRLLNEPTAAAVAYGLDSGDEGVVAVYDLGGGTFDISLLRLNRGVFEVLATGGNSALGGDDFDRAIAQWLIAESGFESDVSPTLFRQLMTEGRRLKEALTDAAEAPFDVDFDGLSVAGILSRAQFDGLIASLVDDTTKACRRAVRDAGVSIDEINNVVMVGGSTRVPLVVEKVGAYFQTEPLTSIDPDRVVAIGAAVQANLLAGNKSDEEMLLLDVLPLSLGIETMGGLTEKIIHRNTAIPVSRAQEFTTYKDGQTGMLVHVVQGERELVSDCRSLARFELNGIPPMVAGAARIEVLYQVDADGLLSVSARETGTGVEASVTVKPSYGLEDDEVARMLKDSFTYAESDMNARSLSEARIDAGRLVEALTHALDADGEALLSADDIALLRDGVAKLTDLAAGEDTRAIKDGVELLSRASDEFAAMRMDASVRKALAGHQLNEFENEA